MSLRVCMVIYHYWPGSEGGTERQCRRLASALSRRGVACTVLTARTDRGAPARARDGEVRIARMPILEGVLRRPALGPGAGARAAGTASASRSPGRAARLAAAGVAWLNALVFQIAGALFLWRHAREFDVIHVHTSEWIAGWAVWVGRRIRRPVLCKGATTPALPPSTRRVPFGRIWDRVRIEAEFVALSDAMASGLKAAGVPDRRIRVIPNSVELPDLGGRREEAGRVLYVGNLTQNEWKAFDVLFDAWAKVHAAGTGARLHVLGGGDPAPWKRYLDERGCRASVVFEGFVRNPDEQYARAALLVLPSRQEGMSNALLEAQSWGIPAVVSNIPANRSVVDDGVNGLAVPVGEAEALASGILRLLGDAPLRIRLGQAARSRMEEGYSIDSVVEKTRKAYQALVRGPDGIPAGGRRP